MTKIRIRKLKNYNQLQHLLLNSHILIFPPILLYKMFVNWDLNEKSWQTIKKPWNSQGILCSKIEIQPKSFIWRELWVSSTNFFFSVLRSFVRVYWKSVPQSWPLYKKGFNYSPMSTYQLNVECSFFRCMSELLIHLLSTLKQMMRSVCTIFSETSQSDGLSTVITPCIKAAAQAESTSWFIGTQTQVYWDASLKTHYYRPPRLFSRQPPKTSHIPCFWIDTLNTLYFRTWSVS